MAKSDPAPQTQSSTSTTTQNLNPQQQQLLDLIMPQITQFAAGVPKRFQGSTIAGFNPLQTAAQEMAVGAASRQDDAFRNAKNVTDFWTSPGALDPSGNPGMRGTIDAAVRPITEQLTQSYLPAVRSEAIGGSNFGSSRQGIAEGLGMQGASRATGDTAAKITNANYQTNVEAQLRAMGFLPTVSAMATQPAQTVGAVGDVRQALEQAQLGEKAAQFSWDQMAPYLQSKEILSFLQGIPGGSTTSTGQSEASTPRRNPIMGALGGAATGASLGSAFGPWGTAIGALGGAGLSFL